MRSVTTAITPNNTNKDAARLIIYKDSNGKPLFNSSGTPMSSKNVAFTLSEINTKLGTL